MDTVSVFPSSFQTQYSSILSPPFPPFPFLSYFHPSIHPSYCTVVSTSPSCPQLPKVPDTTSLSSLFQSTAVAGILPFYLSSTLPTRHVFVPLPIHQHLPPPCLSLAFPIHLPRSPSTDIGYLACQLVRSPVLAIFPALILRGSTGLARLPVRPWSLRQP